MKKIIALLLCAVMCLSFVACSNNDEEIKALNEKIEALEEQLKNDSDNAENVSKEIIGTWVAAEDSMLAGFTFVFNEDCTGTIKGVETKWKYDRELSSYIIANASGEVYCVFEIIADDSGARYFKISGSTFYYQD